MRVKALFEKNWLFVALVLTTWFKFIYFDRQLFDVPVLSVFLISTFTTCLLIFGWTLFIGKFREYIMMLVAIASSLILLANNIYFRYFGSIVKFETLSIIKQTEAVGLSINSLIQLSDVIYFIDILFLIVFFIFYKRGEVASKLKERIIIGTSVVVLGLLTIGLVIFFDFSNIKKFVNSSFDNNLVERRYGILGAHSLNIFRYVFVTNVDVTEEEKQEVVEWIKNNKVGKQEDNNFTDIADGKNIFLIQIESLQTFAIGMEVEGEEVTPNLNDFVSSSYYFPNGESPIGGGLTSDSDFMANTSLNALTNSSAFVTHGSNDFTSLPKALNEAGYESSAFHAFKRDFWNRNVAFNSLGFDNYFAQDNYEEGENVILGLNDKSFYEQTLNKIPEKIPSFNYLISLSSHHPFIMPGQFQTLDVKYSDEYDYVAYHYLQSINYADHSLGVFIDGLKKKGLYDDSLIVIYGDHPAKFGEMENEKVRATVGSDINPSLVPYIYKLPGQKESKVYSDITKQIDIMPTILNLVGIKTNFPIFGRDILSEGETSCGCELTDDDYYSEALIKYNLFEYFY